MANRPKQLHHQISGRRIARPTRLGAARPSTPAADGPSPQDFYRELVGRPDVRVILTRLAQIRDAGA